MQFPSPTLAAFPVVGLIGPQQMTATPPPSRPRCRPRSIRPRRHGQERRIADCGAAADRSPAAIGDTSLALLARH